MPLYLTYNSTTKLSVGM